MSRLRPGSAILLLGSAWHLAGCGLSVHPLPPPSGEEPGTGGESVAGEGGSRSGTGGGAGSSMGGAGGSSGGGQPRDAGADRRGAREPPWSGPWRRAPAADAAPGRPPPGAPGALVIGGRSVPRDKVIVFIHIGHSNMAGRTNTPPALRPFNFETHPQLWAFTPAGVWQPA